MASWIAPQLFVQQIVQANNMENIYARYFWPFVCEGTTSVSGGFRHK